MRLKRAEKEGTPEAKPEAESAWALLDCAPPVPHIRRMEDAVAFVDKYSRWKRKVESRK